MATSRSENETFSSVDATWLRMDSPTNLALIVGILTFDVVLDFERLKSTIEHRLLVHRRFRQRVRESTHLLELPTWEPDPDFTLEAHLLRTSLPEPGDHLALQELVGDLMSKLLDPSRPLWQFHFVDNYLQGSALICRLHHCIADGMALVQVLLSIADEVPDAPWPQPAEKTERQLSPLAQLLMPAVKATMVARWTCQMAESLIHEGMDVLIHPTRIIDAARMTKSIVLALGKLLLLPPDRKTLFRGRRGLAKRVAWSTSVSLEEVKGIGRRMGGTVNDILLSAVTGALRRYLEERGQTVIGLDIRAVVPVNLRPPGEIELMGNRFGLVFLSLPVGLHDPIKRLAILRRRMNAIKDTPEALVAIGILGAIGMTPAQIERIIVTIFGMKGTTVMTNVPGPRRPLYFAGGKIDTIMFWVPTPGDLGLGISIISYAGNVLLGVATDESLIPDPQSILQNFQDELEFLRGWGRSPARAQVEKL